MTHLGVDRDVLEVFHSVALVLVVLLVLKLEGNEVPRARVRPVIPCTEHVEGIVVVVADVVIFRLQLHDRVAMGLVFIIEMGATVLFWSSEIPFVPQPW